MKIKVPEARETVKATSSNSQQEESLSSSSSPVSPPSSTPGSPTSVDTELDEVELDSCANKTRAGRRNKRPRPVVSTARKPRTRRRKRLEEENNTNCVSSGGEDDDDEEGPISNVEKPSAHSRCVSDDAAMCHQTTMEQAAPVVGVHDSSSSSIPPLPNPLYHKSLCQTHVSSLRLEFELAPMKSILFKLMGHAQYNRRGIFNAPVDPIALNLTDYDRIVSEPMDLGTIKAKLHALAYTSREQVADDVRLVFRNAILYNPPQHFVHVAARNLLGIFEAGYLNACQRLGDDVDVSSHASEPLAAVAFSRASIPTTAAALLPSEKPADENTATAATTNGHLPASPPPTATSNTSTTGVKKRLFPTSPPVGTRRQPQAAPKLPVHFNNGDGKVPPWLRPNRKKLPVHSCSTCLGRTCGMCQQGCLTHEPALLICSGTSCGCAKIRKLAVYYVSPDGTRQYCQKCYAVLSAVLPQSSEQSDAFDSTIRYKKDLLKRKNDEEIAEHWLSCTKCQRGVHQVCAMHNEFVHNEDEYVCPTCVSESLPTDKSASKNDACSNNKETFYTFLSGSGTPIPMNEIGDQGPLSCKPAVLSADQLKETPVSAFIQEKVREQMVVPDCPNANRTVSVRIISDCEKSFSVPDVVRKHFRVPSEDGESHLDASVLPPDTVGYRSLAIALFQKIDGLDVCIFCMYVQEYDGDDEYQSGDLDASPAGQGKRVYIAYLDSVEHFRPRSCRTNVYHEMLVSYLATARARGYETAHIWACPPARGNSFVFWNHPSMQRTPTKERLISWYHGALHRAVDTGVVTDIKSMYESAFEEFMSKVREEENGECIDMEMANARPGRMVCPPLLDGDYWIEEAQRLHAASLLRFLKSKSGVKEAPVTESMIDGCSNVTIACPALQAASLIRNTSALEAASPFRRPVNAAALNLKDYHRVISKPMDLGTIYSQCVLGEYDDLQELVSDVSLVFSNAKRYNPIGHPIHTMAVQVEQAFFKELNSLSQLWQSDAASEGDEDDDENPWLRVAELSMSLDTRVVEPIKPAAAAVETPAPESLAGEDALPAQPESSEAIVTAPSLQAVVSSDDLSNPVPEAKDVPSDPVSKSADAVPQTDASLHVSSAPVSATASGDAKSCSTATAPDRPATALEETPAPKRRGRKPKPPPKRLDLLTDGPDAVHHSMVGEDVWLLDNRPPPPKNTKSAKKNGKRKKTERERQEEPPSKRRRQSWLGEQVGVSMRKIRTAFFTCSLMPKAERNDVEHGKLEYFDEYIQPFATFSENLTDTHVAPSSIADARHHLLEFSQYRNFEFDTLRRAKYSTAMILYHLHNDNAPGLVPSCSSCSRTIHHVRWHEVRKRSIRNSNKTAEELCSDCHSSRADGGNFLPCPVSFRSNELN